MGIVIYNGISSLDFRIQVEHPPGYDTPSRDYEIVHVPGRNGDVIIDKKSYQNITRTYPISIGDPEQNFADLANTISEWLHSASGYARLEDTYEPNYYRMASYIEETNIENILFHGGRATINFTCKPQRYLKIGERPIVFQGNRGVLKNPTRFDALPIIQVTGSGAATIKIGVYEVQISNIGGSITINSEIQDAYSDAINRNSSVYLPNGFPKLNKGDNIIVATGSITKLEIIPGWWTL